jgi:hypothetical protein
MVETGHCPNCRPDEACGGYHVYVIELDEGTKYDFYVGYTGKTVRQRLIDNWVKYGSQCNGPKLIRNNFSKVRMDLVPKHSIVRLTREDAEHLEAELADKLRDQGHKVKGPKLRLV